MIGHRVQDDGVLVTLKQSWGTAFATLTESQAKRFAWGILADLDPDGVERLRTGSAHGVGCIGSLGRRMETAAIKPRKFRVPRPFDDDDDDKLICLFKAGVSQEGIAERMGRTRGSIAGRVDRLRRKGKL